jgi:Carboxypeptidase regulatory-like domain
MTKIAATLGVLALAILIPVDICAQVSRAKLSGTITDTSGAVIANAKLSAKNVDTGEVTEIATNKVGIYQSPVLPSGTYEITVSAPGFPPEVRTGVFLTAGVDQVLNLSLGRALQPLPLLRCRWALPL